MLSVRDPLPRASNVSLVEGIGESKTWDGLQREQDEPTGSPTGTGEPTCGPTGEPTNQFCSSYNQKKPLIDFGRFLTCNACRQRNTKANRVRKAKQKATIPPRPKVIKEQLEYTI